MTWPMLLVALGVSTFGLWVAAVVIAQAIERAAASIALQRNRTPEPSQPTGNIHRAHPASRTH